MFNHQPVLRFAEVRMAILICISAGLHSASLGLLPVVSGSPQGVGECRIRGVSLHPESGLGTTGSRTLRTFASRLALIFGSSEKLVGKNIADS
jgi:hypothetical protein